MGREMIMLLLLMGLLGVAAAIFTVVFEIIQHRRKQAKYEALHRGMGLDPEPTQFGPNGDR